MRRPEAKDYECLLSAHGQSVWRLIVRMLGNDGHDAADCFQQAFVELVSRAGRSSDVRDAGALLKRIASRRAVDVVRRRIRERNRTDDGDVTLLASQRHLQPAARAEIGEFVEDLRAALAELPEPQSAAFILTQIDGLSNEHAAAALGTTTNHFAVLLHRARATLRTRLAAHCPNPEPRS